VSRQVNRWNFAPFERKAGNFLVGQCSAIVKRNLELLNPARQLPDAHKFGFCKLNDETPPAVRQHRGANGLMLSVENRNRCVPYRATPGEIESLVHSQQD
jgi:hypothetical protein